MTDHNLPCHVGRFAAFAVVGLSLAYAAVLVAGLVSLSHADQPIGDPWFSILEVLILAIAPTLVLLTAAIHATSAPRAKVLSLSAVLLMSGAATLTASVHFAILVLGGLPQFSSPSWGLVFSFRWPSVAYAIDILAWDVLFALSMICAAPVFNGKGLDRAIRRLIIASALLALAGLAGPATGDMNLRNVGIAGYAAVFPIAAGLLGVRFHRQLGDGGARLSRSAVSPP